MNADRGQIRPEICFEWSLDCRLQRFSGTGRNRVEEAAVRTWMNAVRLRRAIVVRLIRALRLSANPVESGFPLNGQAVSGLLLRTGQVRYASPDLARARCDADPGESMTRRPFRFTFEAYFLDRVINEGVVLGLQVAVPFHAHSGVCTHRAHIRPQGSCRRTGALRLRQNTAGPPRSQAQTIFANHIHYSRVMRCARATCARCKT